MVLTRRCFRAAERGRCVRQPCSLLPGQAGEEALAIFESVCGFNPCVFPCINIPTPSRACLGNEDV